MEHLPGPDPSSVFEALGEAIGILRADAEEPDARDAIREAHMRKVLRRTVRDGFERIAVVCGAWHVPALRDLPPAAADDRLLRGLPKVKATLTWVPWTYGRLSYTSGYGAGIRSPGWYDHLFGSPGQPIERWLAKAAAVLREEGIPASSAHVIESVRLAQALAALRGRPLAGLDEVTEAARSVLCEGSDLLTELIQRRLVVGERLGTVPPATPMVPLQRDLQDQQRHLRLRPEAEPRDYDLDLRKPNDLARSRLLYRLALLEVPWGTPQESRIRNIGTFRESWQLTWGPELDLALIEASMWGSTVAAAAAQRARSIAAGATALDELTALTERCLLADLGDALPAVLAAVRDRAALDTDVTHLMAALPALVRAARYGDVRGTDPARLGEVAIEMITRICAGLLAAVASLDETAERVMRERIDAVNSATGLLADGASRDRWLDTLAVLARGDDPPRPPRVGIARGDDPPRPPRVGMALRCPPLISGRLTRLLLDAGRLAADDAASRMSRALSAGAPAPAAAGWTEGFLAGSGLLLVHDDKLLALADGWLAGLSTDAFAAMLPALRRTFGEFAPPERRAIGQQAARLDGSGRGPRWSPQPATTSTRSGRHSRPGPWLSFSGGPGRWRHDRRPRRADAALAPGARRGGGHRDAAGRRRRADRRGSGRALRLRPEHWPARFRSAGCRAAAGRVRRIRTAHRPLARRHPRVLPGQRGAGHAEGRHRAARSDPAAARAGDAGRGSSPTCTWSARCSR